MKRGDVSKNPLSSRTISLPNTGLYAVLFLRLESGDKLDQGEAKKKD